MRHFSVYQEPQGNMMIVQVLQVFARKYGLHFFRQFFGVVASDAEGNDATDITKDGARYLLPAYFAAFSNALRSDILYSNIVNNIGTLFAETEETEEARKCFLEAIDFTPQGVRFDNPHTNLENLK